MTPALVYLVLFFFAPLAVMLGFSLLHFSDYHFVGPPSLANYITIVTAPSYLGVFARTVFLSLVAAVIAVVLAYPFTYVITFVYPARSRVLYFLILVCLFGGYLVRVYAWRTILGAEGVVNGSLMSLGIIDTPWRWMLNSSFAVVLTTSNFLVPLAVVPLYSSMQNVSPRLLEAARDLGSSPLDVSRRIVLPLVIRGLIVSLVFCFIASAGEFAIPSLLGGIETSFVGNQIQFQFGSSGDWPLGAAMAVWLVVVVVAFAAFGAWLLRRGLR